MKIDRKKLIKPAILASSIILLCIPGILKAALIAAGIKSKPLLYDRQETWVLLLEHINIVAISSAISISLAILAGILVTRKNYTYIESAISSMSSLMQTIPPIAVISMAVPLLGFGFAPTMLALAIYGFMPVLNNTIAGIKAIDPAITEAARGMGMTEFQVLTKIELPLAWPLILAGIRTNTVINTGTATLGAVVGAGGLGVIIIAGLTRDNLAMILTGALLSALLAFFADSIFDILLKNNRNNT